VDSNSAEFNKLVSQSQFESLSADHLLAETKDPLTSRIFLVLTLLGSLTYVGASWSAERNTWLSSQFAWWIQVLGL
jgi:hypothetical protein